MRGALVAKLALGSAAIMTGGSLAGLGLANYVASGSFDFYRQPRVAEWRPERPSPVRTRDLAFTVPTRAGSSQAAGPDPAPQYASFDY